MKKIIVSTLVALAGLQSFAQQIKLSSTTPSPGEQLSIVYDPSGGALDRLADVKCKAYTFANKAVKPIDLPLQKDGNVFKASFKAVDSLDFAFFVFSAGDTKDENPTGYFTQFYENGKPTAMAHYWEAQYWLVYGPAYAKVKVDKTKALTAYEKAFATDPALKEAYLIGYISTVYGVDKPKAELMANQAISNYKAKEQTEENLIKVGSLFTVIKKKPAADSIYTLVKAKYPKGKYAFGQAGSAIFAEKNTAVKEEKLNAMIANFGLDLTKKDDVAKVNTYYAHLAEAYAAEKNNTKFEFYSDKITSKSVRASVYNEYAWASFEAKNNLEFAAVISKKSLDLIESAKKDPKPEFYPTQQDYVNGLDGSFASYADTYAAIEDALGQKEEALKYQEIAVTKNRFSSADMNARYVNLLAKNGKFNEVATYAERFIKEGQGTEQMKADLKMAYKGSSNFDTYYASLEKEFLEKEKAKFVKEMINTPAPKFALMNLQGQKVDLASLKGKVVVVDYWATWCGPCIASFPGMQKAVDKYKNDPNVVFLFINTWQTEANREKVVNDWLATTKYTFNILLDTKNTEDPSKFDVIEKYGVEGIPTKFIVDGNGNIRFKKVGFSGTADGVVKELDMMIDLAKAATKSASK